MGESGLGSGTRLATATNRRSGVGPGAGTGDTILSAYHVDWPAWGAADSVSGMTFTRTQNSSELSGGSAGQNWTADSDDGDYMEYLFDCDAGTYTLTIIHDTFASGAIIEFLIDASSLGTVDEYSGSTIRNNVATFTGIALTAGVHTLKLLVNGKNASSADYVMLVQWLSLDRTGA